MDLWRPDATMDVLRLRAIIIVNIRSFFAKRHVLEVETPLLSHGTVTDPHIHGIPVVYNAANKFNMLYLQTSPEYAMKRLLAAGSGPIYQLCKAFRYGDSGRFHNPEFTMLEWYRPGFDHHALMNEVDELLQFILLTPLAERVSYATAFEKFLKINPHTVSFEDLITCVREQVRFEEALSDRNMCLDLLLTHCIEPYIGQDRPVFLYDFPVSQAALSKIRLEDLPVASRFEVYFKGIELANGFHELQDVNEQHKRFENDLVYRATHHLPNVNIDERFLSALNHGIPDCAGVAMGVDRLVMLALSCQSISEVMSFGFERA